MVTIKLEGFEAIKQSLLGMPDKLMRGYVAPATRNAARNIVQRDMKAHAPRGDKGWIRKSIKTYSDTGKRFRKFRRFSQRDYVSYITGPLANVVPISGASGKKFGKIRPWWAIFFERGRRYPYDIPAGKNKTVLATYGATKKGKIRGGHFMINNYGTWHTRKYAKRYMNKSGWIIFAKKGGKPVTIKSPYPMKPFIRPALHKNVVPIISMMRSELNKGVRDYNINKMKTVASAW